MVEKTPKDPKSVEQDDDGRGSEDESDVLERVAAAIEGCFEDAPP